MATFRINPQVFFARPAAAMPLNRFETDQKTVAERQWNKPKLAPKPQRPCDHGLFSDDANQLDLIEMFQDPTNE